MRAFKKNSILIVATLLCVIALVAGFSSIIIKNNSILIFPGDSYEQMFQFYLGAWERYRDLSLSQWDWSMGLGGSFVSYVYYFATSPFFLLSLLFDKDFIKYTFLYFNMFKIAVLFLGTYYWLGKLNRQSISRIAGSFMIAFSGWVFFYFAYNMFLDAFIFYPFILGLADDYLKKNKRILFVLSIGFLGIVNYYFLYMFVPFCLMYGLLRYVQIYKGNIKIQELLIAAGKYLFYVLLGVGISAIVLIPTAYIVLGSSRFSGTEILSFFVGKKDLYKIISSFFVPVTERYNCNVLIDVSNHNSLGWGGGVSLFASSSVVLLLILLLFTKDKFEKITYSISFLVLMSMMSIFGFYKLFQFRIDSRWFYMMLFLTVMICTYVIDEILTFRVSRRAILASYLLCEIAFAGIIFVGYYLQLFALNTLFFKVITAVVCFQFLFFVSFCLKGKLSYFLILVVFCESVWCTRLFLDNNHAIHSGLFENSELDTMLVDKVEEINPEGDFYRLMTSGNKEHYDMIENVDMLYEESDKSVSKEEFKSQITDYVNNQYELFTLNDPFAKNYAGVSFYNSLYSNGAEDFISRFKGNWAMYQAKGRTESYALLSVKYWCSNYKTKKPPYGFELVYESDNIYIYENKYYFNLGTAYSETLNSSQISSMPTFMQDLLFLDYLVYDFGDSKEHIEIPGLYQIGTYSPWEVHTIEFDEYLTDLSFYFVTGGIDNLAIQYYSDDVLVLEEKYSQFQYTNVIIDNDLKINRIDFICNDYYSSMNSIDIYAKSVQDMDSWINRTKNYDFYDVQVDRDVIYAKIDIEENHNHIFTSVPWDKGWSVYVDGEKTEIYKCQLGFIGFDAETGEHQVKFVYTTPYLAEGCIISVCCLLLLFILVKKERLVKVFKRRN